ncbi:MAG TPA: hypothetical protein VKT29_00955, partial [Terriglobales bacterium]|nr:hypothetical protein [Terriglobales bacterium]
LGTLGAMALMRLAIKPIWVCRACVLSYARYMSTFGIAVGGTLLAASLTWLICGWTIRPAYLPLAGSAGAAFCVYASAVFFLVFSSAERQRAWSALRPWMRRLHAETVPTMANAARQAH